MAVPLRCNAFQKVMWCTCLWRHNAYAQVVWCLWCMLAGLGYPQNEIAIGRTITSWVGVCVASRILTTKIPSALLVAIMWLQRTWRPRFRHDTFSYGITTSPNTRDRVEDIENTPCVCTLVHPRFPNAQAMQMHAQEGTWLLFMFQKVVSKTTGNKLMLHVRSNQDKDINTKNILVLQHV
jgi:hypothetical protein